MGGHMPGVRSTYRQGHLGGWGMLWLACLVFLLCLLAVPSVSWAEELQEDQPASDVADKGSEPSVKLAAEAAPSPTLATSSDAQGHGIPALQLTIDPEEYEKMIQSDNHEYRATGASISLDVPSGYTGEFSESELPGIQNLSLEYIRGRGNSTWFCDKKPFKFKLGEKTDLLGMGGGKHWVLLANDYDDTLLRNRITSYIGRRLGLAYTPRMVPVDLFVNDTYEGSYVLCPQVRVDNNSVSIDDLGASDLMPPEVTGGYLIALNPYDDEDGRNMFTTSRGVRFFFDDPDFSEVSDQNEAALQAQRTYISSYLQRVEDALFAEGMADGDGVPYGDYMDLQSAAAYWWVQEFSSNTDAFATPSTYLYKKRDGKLHWGPLWDFDLAYEKQWSPAAYKSLVYTDSMRWLDHMRDHDERYVEMLRSTWDDLDAIVEDIVEEGGVLDQYAREIEASWTANYERWKEEYDPSFNEAIEELRTFMKARRDGIRESIGEGLTNVCITVRFLVDGQVVRTTEIRRGDMLTDNDFPPNPTKDGFYFLTWTCGNGEDAHSNRLYEDTDVQAVFIADEEVTRPIGVFFPLPDVWVSSDSGFVNTRVVVTPPDAIDQHLTWTSSDPSVANIRTTNGTDWIKPTQKVGQTTFTCTTSSGLTASFTLHVYDHRDPHLPNIEEFQLEGDLLELEVGQYGKMGATVLSQPHTGWLCYESSDPAIAEVFKTESTGVIKGVSPGTCKITVRNWESTVEHSYTVVVREAAEDVPATPEDEPATPEDEPVPPEDEPAAPKAASYYCASGDGEVWTKGSGKPLALVFKRTEEDASTFDHFAEVLVDGEKVGASDFTTGRGSLVLTLAPEFLEGLDAGPHAAVARFDDGSARAAFLVERKAHGGGSVDEGGGGSTGGNTSRNTGESAGMNAGNLSEQDPVAQGGTATQGETQSKPQGETHTVVVEKASSNQLPKTGDDTPTGLAFIGCLTGLIALAKRRGL